MEKTCASAAFDIRTYYAGKNQATHPNVISFSAPWHGYRYWMAYTAYPYADGSEENPCIAGSNDLLHWEKPAGLINPIACCEETECDELKDTHLLYRADLDRLEVWYLGRIGSSIQEGGPLYCFRKTSADGIHWSSLEVMYQFSGNNMASPSVLYSGGYHLWGIRNSPNDTGLYYMFSEDGTSWSPMKKCSVERDAETDMWHGTVSQFHDQYYFVWVGHSGKHRQHIFLATSQDGQQFSGTKTIIANDTGWAFLYRPALLKTDEGFYCYYGVIRCDNKWMIAGSFGKTPDSMVGIGSNEITVNNDTISQTPKLKLKQKIHTLRGLMIPRVFLLTPLFFVMLLLVKNLYLCWAVAVIFCMIIYRLRFHHKAYLAGGFVSGSSCMAIAVFVQQLIWEFVKLM